MTKLLFILGAGASVSSGLPTYRGPDGIYPNNEAEGLMTPWNMRKDLPSFWKSVSSILDTKHIPISRTYQLLGKIASTYEDTIIITQNIDGLIHNVGISENRIWEIHGNNRNMRCETCKLVHPINLPEPICLQCDRYCRPDVVLFTENIDEKRCHQMNASIKRYRPDYVIIIGSTLLFPYINHFILAAKSRGCQNVININPNGICSSLKMDHWKMSSDDGLAKLCAILDIKFEDI